MSLYTRIHGLTEALGKSFDLDWDYGAKVFVKSEKPTKKVYKGPWTSAGGVVIPSLHPEEMFNVYLIMPRGKFGGKTWTLPKGRIDEGETKQQAAVREVREETGIKGMILPGSYLGKFKGTMSVTHFYIMLQTGSRGQHDQEVERVKLVPFSKAFDLLRRGGNKRDVKVLAKARNFLEKKLLPRAKKGHFRKRVSKVIVDISAKDLAKELSIEVGSFLDKKGKSDKKKTVLKLDKHLPVQKLQAYLRMVKMKPLSLRTGGRYHIAVVDARRFKKALAHRHEPTLT